METETNVFMERCVCSLAVGIAEDVDEEGSQNSSQGLEVEDVTDGSPHIAA